MPLDAMTLTALAYELESAVTGMKIEKIRSPERDMLVMSLRGSGASRRLLISAGGGSARVHLTEAEFENPSNPPMFCMLLRKHLQGGRIAGLTQPEGERMLTIEVDFVGELGDMSRKRLVVEMMGRSANIILVGPDGRIIDCLRRVGAECSEKRQVLPGLFYENPPKQEKPDFLAASPETRRALWGAADIEKTADKWLLESFSGISPLVCRELCHRAFGDASKRVSELSENERKALPIAMDALSDTIERREWLPIMLTRDEAPFDFSFLRVSQYGDAAQIEQLPSFSSLLDAFYTRRDKVERLRRKSSDIIKAAKSASERVARRLDAQKSELKATENRDELRQKGDLITSNLHLLKKGMTEFFAENFYLEGSPKTLIALDPLLSPSQNAAKYFRAYNKAKSAEKYLSALITAGGEEYEYLCSVLEETQRAESESDLSEIRAELMAAGYLKKRIQSEKGRREEKEKAAESMPRKFLSSAGFEILVGRNNAQNDALSMKIARGSDLWLHVQKAHGAHVVVVCRGNEPDDASLMEAASLAAWYSSLRESPKAAVDYTKARNVKKPNGAMPGRVIYTDYKTVIAEPKQTIG